MSDTDQIKRQLFKREITIGNLLSMLTIVVGMVGIWSGLNVRLSVVETRLNFHEKLLMSVSDNQTQILRTQERLTALIEKQSKP